MIELKPNIATIIKILLGSALGVLVGYIIYSNPAGAEGKSSFHYWIEHPIRRGVYWWAIGGGVFAYLKLIADKALKQ